MKPEPTTAGRALRVFLCHSSGDKPSARDLYHRLKRDGSAPWLDEENLLAGQDWQDEIQRAVRGSDAVIVCLSRSSVTKEGYVQKEIKVALDVADEKPPGTIFIIPVRLEIVDVPSRLAQWQWVDLFHNGGYEKLAHALRTRAASIHTATGVPRNAFAATANGTDNSQEGLRGRIRIIEHDVRQEDAAEDGRILPRSHRPFAGLPVKCMTVLPDGYRLISGSGTSLKVWDLETGRELASLQGRTGDIQCIAVSQDCRWAVSGSRPQNSSIVLPDNELVTLWDLTNYSQFQILHGSKFGTWGVAVSNDGLHAISSHTDGLKLWDRSGRLLHTFLASTSGIAVPPDGRLFCCRNRGIEVWDFNNPAADVYPLLKLSGSGLSDCVAVSPDGGRAVAGGFDKTVRVWDAKPKKFDLFKERSPLFTLRGHGEQITSVAVSPDGKQALSASLDTTLKVWDLQSGVLLATIACDSYVNCCAWSKVGIAAGDSKGRIHLFSFP
jgi:WD40 repeat protein